MEQAVAGQATARQAVVAAAAAAVAAGQQQTGQRTQQRLYAPLCRICRKQARPCLKQQRCSWRA
jgi:hypothetical protein